MIAYVQNVNMKKILWSSSILPEYAGRFRG